MTYFEMWSVAGQYVFGAGTVAVAIVLGIFTCKISKIQVELTKQNLKIELFKERHNIYNKLHTILEDVILIGKEHNDTLGGLRDIRDEVKFLFDEDIHKYLVVIINKYQEYSPYSRGETKDDNFYELHNWFINQFTGDKELRKKFSKYLDLGNYGLSKK